VRSIFDAEEGNRRNQDGECRQHECIARYRGPVVQVGMFDWAFVECAVLRYGHNSLLRNEGTMRINLLSAMDGMRIEPSFWGFIVSAACSRIIAEQIKNDESNRTKKSDETE
jgi:hypothetical protein